MDGSCHYGPAALVRARLMARPNDMTAKEKTMHRRRFLEIAGTASLSWWAAGIAHATGGKLTPEAVEEMRRSWQTLVPKGRPIPSPQDVVTKSREDWRKALSPSS